MSSQTSQSEQSDRQSDSTPDTSVRSDVRLNVLGDECSRTILVATSDGPRTAKELTELTDCSSATVYRRINDLLDGALLEECVRFEDGGSHTTAYVATVEQVCVTIDSGGIDVTVTGTNG